MLRPRTLAGLLVVVFQTYGRLNVLSVFVAHPWLVSRKWQQALVHMFESSVCLDDAHNCASRLIEG
eukprot:6458529-Amphidinium_carterae.1